MRNSIVLFCLLCFIPGLYAQDLFTISGHVTDVESGEELIGATLFITNMSRGTATNTYGFYSLSLTIGTYQIEVSYIGYESAYSMRW